MSEDRDLPVENETTNTSDEGGFGYFEGNQDYVEDNSDTGNAPESHEPNKNEHHDSERDNNPTPVDAYATPKRRGISKTIKIAIGSVIVIALFGLMLLVTMQQQPSEDMPSKQPDAEMSLGDPALQDAITSAQVDGDEAPMTLAASEVSSVSDSVSDNAVAGSSAPAVSPSADDYLQALLLAIDDGRIQALETRVARIEEFLSQYAKQSTKKKVASATGNSRGKIKQAKKAKRKTAKATTVHDDNRKDVSVPAIAPTERNICTYLGALNNRAWVSCNDNLHSVKPGDTLPQPYGTVTAVDDSIGSVTTVGGTIR